MFLRSTSAKAIDLASAARVRVSHTTLHAEAVKQRARLSMWRAVAFVLLLAELALYFGAGYLLSCLFHLILF